MNLLGIETEQGEKDPLPSEQQKIMHGYGPVFHRVYSIVVPVSFETARRAMGDVMRDPNMFAPTVLAEFEKRKGDPSELAVGDEFQIYITGPWNGPVRVKDVTETSFRLVTLEGHMEAGEIEFRISDGGDEGTLFEIESLARSADRLVDFVYDKLPVAKLAQTQMWTAFCKAFHAHALEADGEESEESAEVEILTERKDEQTGEWQAL